MLSIEKKTSNFFGEKSPLRTGGEFGGAAGYEFRPQQGEMAVAIARCLETQRNLCVEAPTGIGKTFAYLVPAIYYAKQTGKAVVVSTHTINLQEQIMGRDLPMLKKVLQDDELKFALAKGRSNYLCKRRLQLLGDIDQELLPVGKGLKELKSLLSWARQTETGDRSELKENISFSLWEQVCSERGNCMNTECTFFRSCFLQRARRQLAQSQIIITNHAFFFCAVALEEQMLREREADNSNGKDKNSALLPEYSAVIFDEGHTIEDMAAENLGLKADSFSLRKLLNRLYMDSRRPGLLSHPLGESARKDVDFVRLRMEQFFERLAAWIIQQAPNLEPLRYTVPGHIENYLDHPCQQLIRKLDTMLENLHDQEELATDLKSVKTSLEELNHTLNIFFAMALPDHVYWFELHGRQHQELTFCCVPIQIASVLRSKIFLSPKQIPVIVTSATLAVGKRIDYFLHRLGAESAETLILDTPFDFQKQVTLFLPPMPDPKSRDFQTEAENQIRHFLQLTNGHAFVLFTSYAMLRRTAENLEEFFQEQNLEVYCQGDGLLPAQMLEKFRQARHGVIFGTDSFWVGVDVPGDALTNVIITKLPFAVPDHPLEQARTDFIAANGGTPFFDYSVPQAVLKFRQGFGRLIRTKNDKGIVVILDSRITSKAFGRIFLNSIPKCGAPPQTTSV